MKKRVFGRKFSRNTNSRQALFRALVADFVKNGKIETTLPRFKAIKPLVDKLVTLARKKTLASRRGLLKKLAGDKITVAGLEKEVSSRFSDLSSGFTRMVRLGQRIGDNALMVRITWSREKKEDISKKDNSEQSKKEKTV